MRLLCALLWVSSIWGQESPKPKSKVVYAAEQQTVPTGKRGVLELRFKVVDGFHVNSHTPKSELLLPTALQALAAKGVALSAPVYPPGQEYSFSFDPTERLDVYTGEFTVKLPVIAEAGIHQVEATLQYQACDKAACYPPKTLPVQVFFTAQ